MGNIYIFALAYVLHSKMCYSCLGFELFFSTNQVLFSFQRKYIFQDHLLCILKHKKKRNDLFAKKETVEIFSGHTYFFQPYDDLDCYIFELLFLWEFWFSLYVFSLCCVWHMGMCVYKQVDMPMSLHVESRGWLCVPLLFLLPNSPTTGSGAHGWG